MQKPATTGTVPKDTLKITAAFLRLLENLIANQRVAQRAKEFFQGYQVHDLYEIFKDMSEGRFLTGESIEKHMGLYGVYISGDDAKKLVLLLDKDQDGKISKQEFIEEIFPQLYKNSTKMGSLEISMSKQNIPHAASKSGKQNPGEGFYITPNKTDAFSKSPGSTTTTSTLPAKPSLDPLLVYLFKVQLEIAQELEEAKMQLLARKDFDIVETFQLFDLHKLGNITLYEIAKKLKKLEVEYSHDSIYLLMRRYDADTDGTLNIFEFESMFSAFNPPDPHSSPTTLAKYLSKLLDSEERAEEVRKNVIVKGLNVVDAFERVDRDGKGCIVPMDVVLGNV
eukprot:TRINITY_DN6196_c0_g3_i1.p1 TRINITY_DN6196_c0_g3~~TRINITY_DN6196_c0_g3_i1.p1  ORF type:complete len:338 (+),score=37.70 TRINITY_DN6196_c0_g3_i1:405-1418(+)